MVKHLLSTLLFVLCSATLALAQPVNDNCDEAEVLPGPGTYNFVTVDATTDGPDHPTSCTSAGTNSPVITIYNDVWYLFTPNWTGSALYSLCGTTIFDSKIAVYQGGATCPVQDGQLLACNEDGSGCSNFTSKVIFDVVAGETYLLRLGGWGNGVDPPQEGVGTFLVEEYIFNGPANDECADAIEIFMDTDDSITVAFTTVDATNDGPQHFGQDCFGNNDEEYDHNNVWYKWTATYTGGLDVSTCNTVNYDSRFAVYGPGASCIPDVSLLVGCSDDGLDENFIACGDYTSHDRFWVEQGGTYYISIGGWSPGDAGSGFFTFKKAEIYTPPVNDNCSDASSAYVITVQQADEFEVIFSGNNQTASYTDSLPRPVCRPTGEFWDVWYTFNSGFNTDLELRFSIQDPGDAQYIIDLFKDCGSPDTSSTKFCFRTDEAATSNPVYPLPNFPGTPTEYRLRIASRIVTTVPGNFWFQLVGEPYSSVDEPALSSFRLYPNPVSSLVSLDFGLPQTAQGHWELLNLLGQPIFNSGNVQFPAGQNRLDYPTDKLAAGTYFFRLTVDGKEKTARFVKQ